MKRPYASRRTGITTQAFTIGARTGNDRVARGAILLTHLAVVALLAASGDWGLGAERPMIVANPTDDRLFRSLIERYLLSGGRSPGDLEATLRTRFPSAIVRRRGLTGEQVDVWYVYRDGHWTGRHGE